MSSIAPSTTFPRATRDAAIVPHVAIHCIMRPPWICPGAPACSGNTQFTISVAVSKMDNIAECRRIPPTPLPGRESPALEVANPSWFYHAALLKSSRPGVRETARDARARVAGMSIARSGGNGALRLDPDAIEPGTSAGMQAKVLD